MRDGNPILIFELMQCFTQNSIISIKTVGLIKQWRMHYAICALLIMYLILFKWNAALVAAFIMLETRGLKRLKTGLTNGF
ncbi:hypothetical protein [Polynucleobacter necessarius]|uniref:hypothetical protein n=1 Tax=Polynucleobacter necessarius TaxID=576610 RepID=UPI001E3E3415|nr:hypothetical protein [Polynucleobacter necessarius]